jgi:molybdenum cofactor guanylyltransferase
MQDPAHGLGVPSPERSGAVSKDLLLDFAGEERAGGHDPESTPANSISAFVLAGGQSRRMGRDKALLTVAGRPLIAHALSALRNAGLSPVIAGARSDLSRFAPIIPDPNPDLGPLAGICAALDSSSARYAVFLPIDLPLLPPSLITYLFRHAQITSSSVTLPSICGDANTFPAVLDRSVLPTLKTELAAGRRGCLAAFHAAAQILGQSISVIPVEFLAQSGHASHSFGLLAALWFVNVNTPGDLSRVERHFAAQIA